MKTRIFLAVFLLQLLYTTLVAQEFFTGIGKAPDKSFTNLSSVINIGMGAGIDYGGFGTRINYIPTDRLEFFGGIGYNLVNAGFSGGIEYLIFRKSKVRPYIGAMYGYNAVLMAEGPGVKKRTFYGPSWNIGLEIWEPNSSGFCNVELILPIKSPDFYESMSYLKKNSRVEWKYVLPPIGLGFGYHFRPHVR